MHGEHQHVLRCIQSQHTAAQERTVGQVEALPRLLPWPGVAPSAPRAACRHLPEVHCYGSRSGWAGAMTCTGCPSTARKVVRKTSWRRTISLNVCASAATLSGPLRRTAAALLYTGSPGAN